MLLRPIFAKKDSFYRDRTHKEHHTRCQVRPNDLTLDCHNDETGLNGLRTFFTICAQGISLFSTFPGNSVHDGRDQ